MSGRRESGAYFAGFLLILLGVIFLLQNLGYMSFGELLSRYWPLILVAIGVKMLFDRREKPDRGRSRYHESAGDTSETERDASREPGPGWGGSTADFSGGTSHSNVFGDIRLRFDGKKIDSFNVNNVFGDIDLDFTRAEFENEARIKISGVFGDARVWLPKGVAAVVKASCLAGGCQIFDERQDGVLKNVTFRTPEADSGQPLVNLEISVQFGDIRVTD